MAYFDFELEERFRAAWTPIIDVYERAGDVVVRVELPGVDRSDIRLRWKHNVLEITGTKRPESAGQPDGRYMCVERQHGRFHRDIAIGTSIDFKNAVAELQNGLLTIRLPKLGEQTGDTFIRID